MKRFFLFISLIFLVLIFLIGFFALNLEYFLNKPYFKEKLKNYLHQRTGYSITYKKIHLNLYKTLLAFEDLRIEGKDFSVALPKGRIDFSSKRFLTFNFYPEKLYFKNPSVKLFVTEEEPVINYERVIENLKKTPPLTLFIKNATIEVLWGENSKIGFENIYVKTNHQSSQLLLEMEALADFCKKLEMSLRFNYIDNFLEATLKTKGLDLSKVRAWKNNFLSKTDFDLSAEVSYEKGEWNIGFTGQAPCLVFKNSKEQLVCGFFQGYFRGKENEFELNLSPLDMKYPLFKGEMVFLKKSKSHKALGHLTALKWEEVSSLFDPFLPKEIKEELESRIKGGLFKNLRFIAEGEDIRDLLAVNNLKIKGEVEEGEVYVPEIALNFSEIKGNLSFENKLIKFSGETKVNGSIAGKVKELTLALFDKEPKISLTGTFEGEGSFFQNLGISLTEKMAFLKEWDISGYVGLDLNLSGTLVDPQIDLAISPKKLKIKVPTLAQKISLDEGIITYGDEKIELQSLAISYGQSYLAGINGEILPLKNQLNIHKLSGAIKESEIYEFMEKSTKLKELFTNYQIYLKEILIDEGRYKGSYEINEDLSPLLDALYIKGSLKGITLKFPLLEEKFFFSTENLPFIFKEGRFSMLSSQVLIEDSPFELEGVYVLRENLFNLSGKGIVKEKNINKLQTLLGIKNSKLELKERPIEIPSFYVFLTKDFLKYEGKHIIEALSAQIEVRAEKDLEIRGKVQSKASNFGLSFIKKEDKYNVYFEGKAEMQELMSLFSRPPIKEGLVEGEVAVNFSSTLLKRWYDQFNSKNFRALIEDYLKEDFLLFPSYLRIENLTLVDIPINFAGNFNLEREGILGKELNLRVGKSSFSGDLELRREEKFLLVKGDLQVKNFDLKAYLKEEREEELKEVKEDVLEVELKDLPLRGDLTFGAEKLVLPTSHILENLRGNLSIREEGIISITLPEINFCGLKFYAELERNPQYKYLFIDLSPSQGEFLDLFSCMYPEEMPKTILEGPFQMEGFFYTDWKKTFLENSYGRVSIKSPRGYLYRAPLIVRVLGFLSPIDLFRGKIPNLENNLLPYEEINLMGEFDNSKLNLDTLFLSAPGFRLFGSGPISLKDKGVSLTFLVSPFKTIDVIIEHIPYLNKLILGKERMFIYLPLEVTGTYDNPTIIPLHPASIGKGLFRFIFKFFGLQEEFFKEKRTFEGFKKRELLERKSENSIRR